MNIVSVPLPAGSMNLSTGSTWTETALESAFIHENDVTAVLYQRWIACYMLYDRNLHHAYSAYLSNKCGWVQQAYKRLEGVATDAATLKNTLTDTFNQILLEDVECFIQTLMGVWKCDRLTVEFEAAKVTAEIFSKPKS